MVGCSIIATQPMNYNCRHDGDGYLAETESHHGVFTVWVCGECSHEVPIDKLPPNHRARE